MASQEHDSGNESDSDRQCPVCLTSIDDEDDDGAGGDEFLENTNFVCGPCHHGTCWTCMKQILNAKGETKRWPPLSASDIHLSPPTLGRCPICRRELSLFDLRDARTSRARTTTLVARDINYWQQSDNPLNDAVYIPYHGRIGQLSFHWDWSKLRNVSEDKQNRPFLNLSIPISQNPDRWRLDNGSLASRVQYFEAGSHFHKDSRTFHGTIRWGGSRLNGSYEWDVILGFPQDYRFISTGRIHMRRDLAIDESKLPEEFSAEQRQICRYPFDGRWTISWKTKSGEEKRAEIKIVNSEYRQSGWPFYLNLQDDPKHPTIRWPRSKHSQTVQDGVNLITEPLGPKVGAKIRWTSTSPNFPEIFWERQTQGPIPSPHVILFGMGQDKQLYQRLNMSLEDSVIPRYHGSSLWGNVFCKRLFVGSASYHFLSPTNSFLSYQHPACRDLPPMDDGTPLPTRVNFHNLEWEPEERKLSATIEWEADFGISWNENVRWKLTMHFDTQYMIILKGGIQCEWCKEKRARPRPPQRVNPHRPPPVPVYVPPKPEEKEEKEEEKENESKEEEEEPERNEEWVMSGYGHDQLYINAAMIERYRNPNVSDADPTEEVDFRKVGQEHCQRLEQEGATKRSLGFLQHVFELAAQKPNSSPIDFLV